MRYRNGLLAAAALSVVLSPAARSFSQSTTQPTTATPASSSPDTPSTTSASTSPPSDLTLTQPAGELGKVVVTSDLDDSREQIAPSLGAVTYSINPAQINTIPGGDNAPFQQVLLRAPGVVEDSFGQEHVRGEHANLTYRVNGVLLPQPISEFGQELDTRLIQSVTLIDGSLPAQFGFHTAGIVDVTTKSGETLNHNEFSLYGGSYDTVQPSLQFGGTEGKFDYFVVGSYNHNGIGVENPSGTHRPIHDYTDQERLFTYFAYRPDDTSRICLLSNVSYADFQIPDSRGLAPSFTLDGFTDSDSSKINDSQNEQEYYTVLAYQKTADKLSFQISGFSRYGQISFNPDAQRDLTFQGVSSAIYNNVITTGLQLDGSYILNDQHTLRAGALADYTSENLDSSSGVFALNAMGGQASGVPFTIDDDSGNYAWESGVYLQDEWRLTPKLTLNYGLRYDRFDSNFDTEDQVSPRVNAVYKIDDATTVHAGYARYFVPPPVQNTSIFTIRKFANTTNTPENFLADFSKVERSHYFDMGISRQITRPWQVSLDGFYKYAHNLVDLGQFGSALIFSPFNYKVGTVYGGELSTTYRQGGFSAFANGSWVETRAHDIDSQQFQISNDELAFIADNDIKLDHEAEFAGAVGASYEWRSDLVYLDFLYSTGLRSGFANTGSVPPHYPVNIGYQHIFHPNGPDKNAIRWRVDVVNLFDEKYELRDGSGIGVGAPQFGERLGVFTGLTFEF